MHSVSKREKGQYMYQVGFNAHCGNQPLTQQKDAFALPWTRSTSPYRLSLIPALSADCPSKQTDRGYLIHCCQQTWKSITKMGVNTEWLIKIYVKGSRLTT